jgi:hypothetical protein
LPLLAKEGTEITSLKGFQVSSAIPSVISCMKGGTKAI